MTRSHPLRVDAPGFPGVSTCSSGAGWPLRVVTIFRSWLVAQGTALRAMYQTTAVHPGYHGWFAGWRPVFFQAERGAPEGTPEFPLIEPRVRTVFHGWFAVRAAELFPARVGVDRLGQKRSLGGLGTVARRFFHGFCARRGPSPSFSQAGVAEGAGDYHRSVMRAEVVERLAPGPGKWIIDGTLGGGGHSEALLAAGAKVLGVDRDPEAIAHATRRLAGYGARFQAWHGNFANLFEHPEIQSGARADGVLLDLGVSSHQLDTGRRGFSLLHDGPLDMRMDPRSGVTAGELVNTLTEAELTRIFREHGEEPGARKIASMIVRERATRAFETTGQLARSIERLLGRRGRIHPATRVFQALRMRVNDEPGALVGGLEAATSVLRPGGILAVITFHSLEDRVVKNFFRERSREWLDRPEWPEPRLNPLRQYFLTTRKALLPGADETRANPRARSAKLRVATRLDNQRDEP